MCAAAECLQTGGHLLTVDGPRGCSALRPSQEMMFRSVTLKNKDNFFMLVLPHVVHAQLLTGHTADRLEVAAALRLTYRLPDSGQ